MYRLLRRNYTDHDCGILYKGGILDAVDNAFKATYRINDKEYDYICDNANDDELEILVLDENSKYSEIKQALRIVDKYIQNMKNETI